MARQASKELSQLQGNLLCLPGRRTHSHQPALRPVQRGFLPRISCELPASIRTLSSAEDSWTSGSQDSLGAIAKCHGLDLAAESKEARRRLMKPTACPSPPHHP